MTESNYPVLCGGTFFVLVLEARKPGTISRNHVYGQKHIFQEKDMLGALAKIVIPELEKNISRSGCSEFKSCKKNLFDVVVINPQSEYYEAFDKHVKTQYTSVLEAMEEFAEKYISAELEVQKRCAKRLLDLICKDKSIQRNEIFYVRERGQSLKEAALAGDALNIYFPALLLGIWHFVVIHRENNALGATTFENWHESRSNSNPRSKRKFISKIGDEYKGEICIRAERFEDSVDLGPSESGSDDNALQNGTSDVADTLIPAAEITVPEDCMVCACCKDWDGNIGRALLSFHGIYGACDAHGNRTLSSTHCCDLFRPDCDKISQYQFYAQIPRIWKK